MTHRLPYYINKRLAVPVIEMGNTTEGSSFGGDRCAVRGGRRKDHELSLWHV